MITLKFSKFYKWKNIEVIELKTYKEFFEFYIGNVGKGCIFDVKDDKNTK